MKLLSKILLITSAVVGIAIINISVLAYFNDIRQADTATIDLANKQLISLQKIKEHSILVAQGELENRKNVLEFVNKYGSERDLLISGGFVDGSKVKSVTYLSPELEEKIGNLWIEYRTNAVIITEEKVFNTDVLDARDYVVQNSDTLFSMVKEANDKIETMTGDLNDVRPSDISGDKVGPDHVVLSQAMETIGPRLLSYTLEVTGQPAERFGAVKQAELASELSRLVASFDSYLNIMLQGGISDLSGNYVAPVPTELRSKWVEVEEAWTPLKENLLVITSNGIRTEPFQNALNFINANTDSLAALLMNRLTLLEADNTAETTFTTQIFYLLAAANVSVFVAVSLVITKALSPVTKMIDASRRIQQGEYGIQVEHKSKDEVGSLVKSFNILSSAMKEKIEQSKEIDKAKDEFLAMITHELKTPLVPIQGYSELLLDGTLGELSTEQKEKLRIVYHSSLSLSQLIQDLLDVRKLELGQLKFDKVSVDADRLVNDAIKIMAPSAEKVGTKLTVFIERPVKVKCDPDRIIQVLTNLVKNAIKFVPEKEGMIEVGVLEHGRQALFCVKDNGVGISKEMQKGLFKKFYQVDTSARRKSEGSGLGLAICKGIVDGHGGEIYVESDTGKGATFYFTLPRDVI
ncbi:MAG: sensor histidine kinase [Nitrososphaerales archaeon]